VSRLPKVVEDAGVEQLAQSLRRHGVEGARIAIVLGSGLGAFAERLSHSRSIPFADIEGMAASRVPGHAGRLVVGEVRGVRVLIQQGRVHLYEGWSAREVARSVRAFSKLGVGAIVLTNAAGGLHEAWKPGTLMRIRDHINLQGVTPLEHEEMGRGTPYDAALGGALERAAAAADTPLEGGVYAGLLGPSYETPAEIRMLAWMGADAVGMSTVIVALAAHASGMRVGAISCVTNLAAGIGQALLSHADVIQAGRESSDRFSALLEAAIPEIARTTAS
jgi:purine-nucleoside phosphorylase